jgi:phosphoglycolate phosphatase
MRATRAVLMDLDGTLIDHFRTIRFCLAQAAHACGLPEPTLEDVRRAVGGGISNTILTLFGPDSPAVERIYPRIWESHLLQDVEILHGVQHSLERLRASGAVLAVFTNKEGRASRRICSHLGWDGMLTAVFGGGDTPWRKPDSRFSRHALEALGVRADEAVLVGDSPYDAEAASVVGMPFIGVTTGTHDRQALRACGAESVHDTMPSVVDELLSRIVAGGVPA